MKKLRPFNLPLFIVLLIFSFSEVYAQVNPENPPIPIEVEVNTAQFLNFGTFTVDAAGGSISINYDGTITSTNGVFPLNMTNRSPGLFDVRAIPGTIIQIDAPTNVPLDGTNGGTIHLDINSFSTGQTFITTNPPPNPTSVYVGGTLRIGPDSTAPPGNYNGTFTLTFIHQ